MRKSSVLLSSVGYQVFPWEDLSVRSMWRISGSDSNSVMKYFQILAPALSGLDLYQTFTTHMIAGQLLSIIWDNLHLFLWWVVDVQVGGGASIDYPSSSHHWREVRPGWPSSIPGTEDTPSLLVFLSLLCGPLIWCGTVVLWCVMVVCGVVWCVPLSSPRSGHWAWLSVSERLL